MPTINQLVRKERKKVLEKSKSPRLKIVHKEGEFALGFILQHLKNQTQR